MLKDAAFAGGWSAVRRMPAGWSRAAFQAGGSYAARRDGPGVRQLRTNLARVIAATPTLAGTDLDALTRAGMRSYARYWQELFRLPSIPTGQILEQTRIEDAQALRDLYAAGNGVILALPHSGNWDLAGAWLTASGIPFTTVAERLRPAALFDRFVAFRESLGMEVIPLTGGAAPFELLADRLRAGRALCLLADRDLPGTGRPVDFFGEPAPMPVGPALLAIRTGAPLVPVSLWFDDPAPWSGRIHAPIADPGAGSLADRVSAMTQALADTFAGAIAQHPQDWHMLARFWFADRRPQRPETLTEVVAGEAGR